MSKKYLYPIIIVLISMVASCIKPDETTPIQTPNLTLGSRIVPVGAEGGPASIRYMLSDAESGASLEADASLFSFSCMADWCKDFRADVNSGTIAFTVEPNLTETSKLASVTVKYADAEAVFSISQSGLGENNDLIANMQFDIEYDIDGPQVKMTVTPEFNHVRYYIAYSKKSEIDEYSDRIQAIIKANVEKFLSGEINALVNYGGYTFEQALDEYTGKGVRTVSMSLNGESDFVGWCCAVNNQAKVVSDVVLKEFRTGTIPPSYNVLQTEVTEINCDRVKYSVKTSNSDQWASLVVPSEEIAGKDDAALRLMFNSLEDVTRYLHFGDWAGTVANLESGREYYILVFGYSWGAITTKINKISITTQELEEGDAAFSLTLEKVTHFRAVCRIEPTLKTKLYYADILYPGETLDSAVKDIISQINWMVENGYGDKLSLLRNLGYRGTEILTKTGLEEGKTYRFFTIPVDENTGDFVISKAYCSEEFTTPYSVPSEAYISISHPKWFSGDEYAKAYPEDGAGAEGYAILPLTVSTHGNVADYWYCIYGDDLTDTNRISDKDLISHLIGFTYTDDNGNEQEYEPDGIKNEPYKVLACEYGKDLTLVSVALDEDDNWGPVIREKIHLTHEGDTPISEFIPNNATGYKARTKAVWK